MIRKLNNITLSATLKYSPAKPIDDITAATDEIATNALFGLNPARCSIWCR
jgi:hypothetical protein